MENVDHGGGGGEHIYIMYSASIYMYIYICMPTSYTLMDVLNQHLSLNLPTFRSERESESGLFMHSLHP